MPKARLLPASYSISRRWTEDDARVVIAAQAASGLPVAAFAAREGIDPQRLYFWRRRVGEGPAATTVPPTFVEVRHAAGCERVEVALRSGRVIRVAESIDPGVLRGLVNALEGDPTC
jgi:transposase-like protein